MNRKNNHINLRYQRANITRETQSFVLNVHFIKNILLIKINIFKQLTAKNSSMPHPQYEFDSQCTILTHGREIVVRLCNIQRAMIPGPSTLTSFQIIYSHRGRCTKVRQSSARTKPLLPHEKSPGWKRNGKKW